VELLEILVQFFHDEVANITASDCAQLALHDLK